jgi:hypothetical protein
MPQQQGIPLSETRMQQLSQKSVECPPHNYLANFTLLQENTTDADVSGMVTGGGCAAPHSICAGSDNQRGA